MDGFALIAEPTRRRILDRLRVEECDVSTLVGELCISQPLVSKHLKVLRTAGAVTAHAVGQRRIYRLGREPLPDVLNWVRPYQRLWNTSLDRLAEALDEQERG